MIFYFFDDDGPEERVTEYSEKATFEDIKHVDEDGNRILVCPRTAESSGIQRMAKSLELGIIESKGSL